MLETVLKQKGAHIFSDKNEKRDWKKFLNAKGRMDDVSPALRAFLNYVAGISCKDPFIQELEQAVMDARRNREWRHEYMTLQMRDQENIEKGREEGTDSVL